jgi:hypothetical protein
MEVYAMHKMKLIAIYCAIYRNALGELYAASKAGERKKKAGVDDAG